MSAGGVQRAAEVFSAIQAAHCDLVRGDTQDILLGKLFERGNDLLKDDFMRIIEMKGWPVRHQPKRALKPLVR